MLMVKDAEEFHSLFGNIHFDQPLLHLLDLLKARKVGYSLLITETVPHS